MHSARIIGIVGTAKNTGKTTVLAELCKACAKRGISLALTGIGYDGEEFDNVTLLGKPRLDVEEGTVVATSEQCLSVGTARLRVIARTGEHTPLGEVLICSVEQRGLVLLAGPNKTPSLETVVARMEAADLILLDGAMNRIAPMSCCADGVIFATGAARTTDITALAHEVEAIERLFRVGSADDLIGTADAAEESQAIQIKRLASHDDLDQAVSSISKETRVVSISCVLYADVLVAFLERLADRARELVFMFDSAVTLLANLPATDAVEIVGKIEERGGAVRYKRQIALIAVTINPFYPRLVSARGDFEPAFVDKALLKQSVSQRLRVPVINIQDDDADKLMDEIVASRSRHT